VSIECPILVEEIKVKGIMRCYEVGGVKSEYKEVSHYREDHPRKCEGFAPLSWKRFFGI